jgi:hypothetical protein
MQFFTNKDDLSGWVKSRESGDVAAQEIMSHIGKEDEKSIVETCNTIREDDTCKSELASKSLYEILSKHNITIREGNMTGKLVKEAQIIGRDAPLYVNMELKVCPKLPFSVGKRLISTYNCRHQCLDSIVFDDDPNRVYCAEALWRRHVMDKFSREFKNKEGKWVGGYINQRFQVFNDDGGNQMELAHGEKTRKPRPHQYSTERRLEEARGEETTDLVASSNKFVKLASITQDVENDKVSEIFSDIIEMTEAGLNDEDIILKVAEHYAENIISVVNINKIAKQMLNRKNGVVYASSESMLKVAALPQPQPVKPVTNMPNRIMPKKNKNVLPNPVNEELEIHEDSEALGLLENVKDVSGSSEVQKAVDSDFPIIES